MKQILLFCAMALITLSGCSKDDKAETLDGTVWVSTIYEGTEDEYTETLTFSKSTVKIIAGDDEVMEFQYTYTPPMVTISAQIEGITVIVTGTISGNKMTMVGVEGDVAVFTKK
jgi:hypothetical protein